MTLTVRNGGPGRIASTDSASAQLILALPDTVPVGDYFVAALDVLVNDMDADGALRHESLRIVDSPAHGRAVVDAQQGLIEYTPTAGYFGADSFTYQMRDDLGALSNAAVVNVAVQLAWHNADKPLDVEADMVIASIEALIIIHELNDRRFSDPVGRLPAQRPPQAMFLDVNADGYAASKLSWPLANRLRSSPTRKPSVLGRCMPSYESGR